MNIKPTLPMSPLDPNGDYMSEQGAYLLAAKIRNFWNLRGFAPTVWVGKVLSSASPSDSERFTYQVRSDMRNGLPI